MEEYHFTCDKCKREVVHISDFTTGYGIINGKTHCYECCAEWDRENMRQTGHATLYLTYDQEPRPYYQTGFIYPKNGKIQNWPGTLSIPIHSIKIGRHNMAGRRFDVWFKFEGSQWHGVQYGDNTQIAHCHRLKKQAA